MAELHLTGPEGPQSILFEPGISIRDILDTTGSRVRSGCRGNGSCGLCRIEVEEGARIDPTGAERFHLTDDELRQGIHLSCQVVPTGDMRIRVVSPAPRSGWRSLPRDEYFPIPDAGRNLEPMPEKGENGHPALGIAVDLGTTNICLTLWDITHGRRLAGRTGVNRQTDYGTDVMTRLVAASESSESALDLARRAVDSIGEAVFDICSRGGLNPRHICRAAIVGNTSELALLANRNCSLLLLPRYWTAEIDCRPEDTDRWCEIWNIGQGAAIEVIPPLAGFVGSDLLADVLATRMTADSGISLLIDFGTNSEIALWDGNRLWVTSAAGGPAFEGSGLSCGSAGEHGAVYQIELDESLLKATYHAVPGDLPKGFCGSGIVDIVACLVRAGELNEKGKFSDPSRRAFRVPIEESEITVTERDIDLVQRAKAAIGAGVQYLIRAAGLTTGDIGHLYVCGLFGRYLNIGNAIAIGLLPDIDPDRIRLCGNTALAGCEMALLSPDHLASLEKIRLRARLINMSNEEGFEGLFVDNLYLRPMERS